MKPLFILLFVLLGGLQYKLWFADGRVQDVVALKKSLNEEKEKTAELKSRNAHARAEVKQLKRGGQALEERARHDLGMIKRGEKYYQVVG